MSHTVICNMKRSARRAAVSVLALLLILSVSCAANEAGRYAASPAAAGETPAKAAAKASEPDDLSAAEAAIALESAVSPDVAPGSALDQAVTEADDTEGMQMPLNELTQEELPSGSSGGQASQNGQPDMIDGIAAILDDGGYFQDVMDWAYETTDGIEKTFQASLEEVRRRRESERIESERQESERIESERIESERIESERIESERLESERLESERLEAKRLEDERQAMIRELLASWNQSWDILSQVTPESPWVIHVNKGTCTVTIYREVQAEVTDEPASAQAEAAEQKAETTPSAAGAELATDTEQSETMPEETIPEEAIPEDAIPEETIPEDALPDASDSSEIIESDDTPAAGTEADAIREGGTHVETILFPVHASPCSIGLESEGGTPSGTFYIQDHLRWHELYGPRWGQWCSHFLPSYLFHSMPYMNPQDPSSLEEGAYNKLGQVASHGCVRLAAIDAKYICDNVPIGSRIEIFDGTAADDPLGTPERPYVGEWTQGYDPTDPEYRPA